MKFRRLGQIQKLVLKRAVEDNGISFRTISEFYREGGNKRGYYPSFPKTRQTILILVTQDLLKKVNNGWYESTRKGRDYLNDECFITVLEDEK